MSRVQCVFYLTWENGMYSHISWALCYCETFRVSSFGVAVRFKIKINRERTMITFKIKYGADDLEPRCDSCHARDAGGRACSMSTRAPTKNEGDKHKHWQVAARPRQLSNNTGDHLGNEGMFKEIVRSDKLLHSLYIPELGWIGKDKDRETSLLEYLWKTWHGLCPAPFSMESQTSSRESYLAGCTAKPNDAHFEAGHFWGVRSECERRPGECEPLSGEFVSRASSLRELSITQASWFQVALNTRVCGSDSSRPITRRLCPEMTRNPAHNVVVISLC